MLSAGDIIGTSPILSGVLHDEPAIAAMNLIGLDYSVVGEDEFEDGIAELRRLQRGGCHPVDGCLAGGLRFRGAKVGAPLASQARILRQRLEDLGGFGRQPRQLVDHRVRMPVTR